MAIISRIRNRAGLLVIVIGLALFAFIIGDFLTSGSAYFMKKKSYVAVINGEGIGFEDYQRKINELEEITKMQRGLSSLDEQATEEVRERTWQEVTQDMVMAREYKKLGLTVHSDELYDLIGGENPHPYIQQFFADPATGIINKANLNQFLTNINQAESDNENKKIWLYIEDLIYSDRKVTKYRTLLRKGLYATTLEAKRKAEEFSKTVDFSYVVKRYSSLTDSTIEISDKEINAYYKKNKELYKQKASRNIRYVVWEVKPSESDYSETKKWINEVSAELSKVNIEDSWQYIKANSDVAPSSQNYAKGELSAKLDSFAFNSSVGSIYGPYFENETYKLARLIDVVNIPDSVKASHILLQPTQENYAQIQAKADSLLKLIKNGADFAALAMTNSTDGSAQKGGDLGWFKEGQMVKPFNDTCFLGKKGDVKIVNSQYGIHIVKIVDQSKTSKKVQVGILTREVRPSEATDQTYYSQASTFGSSNNTAEKFNAAVNSDKTIQVKSANLTTLDNGIPEVDRSREIVRWAYEAQEGEVTTKVYQFEDKYVVAILDKIREEGYASVEDVKNVIQIELRKQKEAEKLIAEFNGAKASGGLSTMATKIGGEVKTATNIRFSSYYIPDLGNEPKIIAAATTLKQSELSEPIEGMNGVYVIQVDKIVTPDEAQMNSFNKSFVERSYMTKVFSGSTVALNELAKIKDNRINFY